MDAIRVALFLLLMGAMLVCSFLAARAWWRFIGSFGLWRRYLTERGDFPRWPSGRLADQFALEDRLRGDEPEEDEAAEANRQRARHERRKAYAYAAAFAACGLLASLVHSGFSEITE